MNSLCKKLRGSPLPRIWPIIYRLQHPTFVCYQLNAQFRLGSAEVIEIYDSVTVCTKQAKSNAENVPHIRTLDGKVSRPLMVMNGPAIFSLCPMGISQTFHGWAWATAISALKQ